MIASNLIELRQARSLSRLQLARNAKVGRVHCGLLRPGETFPAFRY